MFGEAGRPESAHLSKGLIALLLMAILSLGLATVVINQIVGKQTLLRELTELWVNEFDLASPVREQDEIQLRASIQTLERRGQEIFSVQDELQDLYGLAIWPAVFIILGVTAGLIYTYWQNVLLFRTQQRLTDERVRSSQATELLREAVDTAPDGFIVFNENDEIVLRNDGVDQVYGRFAEAIQVGNKFEDIVHHGLATGLYRDLGDDPGQRQQFFDDRVSTHQAGQGEFMYHGTDNRWVRVIERRSASGFIVSVATELTKMKETEAALRTSEARYRGMLEDQHEFIVRFGPDLSISFANSSYLAHLGASEQSLVGKRTSDLIDEDNLPIFTAAIESLTQTHPSQSCELLIKDEHGNSRWEQWTHRAIFNEHGEQSEVQAIGRDITSEKLATQALEISAKQFRDIADAHPVPVVLVRLRDWKILHANQASIPLLGHGLDEITKHRMLDYLGSTIDAQRLTETLERRGSVEGLETEIVTGQNHRFTAELAARRTGFSEEPIAAVSIIDMTERLAAIAEITRQRNALAQSEKLSALGSLLASVSHELNNPLAVVLGQAQLLQELAKDEAVKHRAEKISHAAQRSARIVKTFLAMVRQRPLARRPVNLNEVVKDALEIAAYALKTSGIATNLSLEPSLRPVQADPDQIIQVAMNLIINVQQALEATEGRRELVITTKNIGTSRVEMSVEDNGPGIPLELRERVFDSFFTTKSDGLGTGIGLSVCSTIVRTHAGQIQVTDSSLGGAKFVVEFPALNAELAQRTAGNEPSGDTMESASGSAILVIDDEPEIATTISDLLRSDGHRVSIANSGADGLEMLKSDCFDLLICDLRMPLMDGAMVYRNIAKEGLHPLNRIMFVTGDALSDHAQAFLRTVHCPVIEKPFDAVEVREGVATTIRDQIN